MKLISCYIENFGGLQEFSYTFTDGFNCICQPNGWGKTTFAAFIKAMLYGMDYSPRKKLEENERKKYMPWQGGAFGGNLVFGAGGKTYRVERFFGAKDKEDTFALYDLATGLPSDDYSERLGEELFHIDAVSYAKSTYIPQNATGAGVTDQLSARLGKIIENANDMDRSTEAIRVLAERQKEYRRIGKKGKLYELEHMISRLEEEIGRCDQKEQRMQALESAILQEGRTRQQWEAQRQELDVQISEEMLRGEQSAKRQHYNQLKQQTQNCRLEVERLKPFFRQGVPTEETIGRCRQLDRRILEAEQAGNMTAVKLQQSQQALERSQQICEEQRENLIQSKETLERSQQDLERRRQSMEQSRWDGDTDRRYEADGQKAKMWTLIGGALLCAGIVLLIICTIVAHVSWVTSLVAIILGIGLLIRGRKEKQNAQAQRRLQRRPEEMSGEAKVAERLYVQAKASMRQRKKEYEESCAYVEELREEILADQERLQQQTTGQQEDRRQLEEILAGYFSNGQIRQSYTSCIDILNDNRQEFVRLRQEYERRYQMEAQFVADNPFLQMRAYTDPAQAEADEAQAEADLAQAETDEAQAQFTMTSLQEKRQQVDEKISACDRTLEAYRKDMESCAVYVDSRADLEVELAGRLEEKAEGEHAYEILGKTIAYLQKAKEQFAAYYMGPLAKGFQHYAAVISEEPTEHMQMDIGLNVRLEERGVLREKEYLSVGYKDFIGVCTRLALADALFEAEKPFLILDDPFVNLDDEKMKRAGKLLKELSDTYQVIYFVCHSSRE